MDGKFGEIENKLVTVEEEFQNKFLEMEKKFATLSLGSGEQQQMVNTSLKSPGSNRLSKPELSSPVEISKIRMKPPQFDGKSSYRLEISGHGVTTTKRGLHTEIFEELKQNRILNMRSDRIGRDIIFHKPYRMGPKPNKVLERGATNRDSDCEISINLGSYATVFQAEITAISACAQEMTRRSYTNKRIQIISDSQAALKALGAVEIHSQVVKDCMDSLTKLAEHNSITLKWMRGHQGHVGNERADFLAKKGAEVPLIGPEPTCGLAYRTAREGHEGPIKRKTHIALGESPRVETLADVHR
ncbi:hypothetical protein NQ318_009515 [Aromia moschata]|uniref:RNase H type-1 domain-containing protein n=1 Tax=Aromia moschata TaxID=1265417 RepID=A0AAV8ZAA4_9CUCU|nr:hypothetical protein NQ318_009515 [Aromia moschata]